MNYFTSTVLPVILGVMLSASGTVLYDMWNRLSDIEKEMQSRLSYVPLLEQMRKELDDHEQRLRIRENEYSMHSLDEFDTVSTNSLQSN